MLFTVFLKGRYKFDHTFLEMDKTYDLKLDAFQKYIYPWFKFKLSASDDLEVLFDKNYYNLDSVCHEWDLIELTRTDPINTDDESIRDIKMSIRSEKLKKLVYDG